jgi:hypothetical protein
MAASPCGVFVLRDASLRDAPQDEVRFARNRKIKVDRWRLNV